MNLIQSAYGIDIYIGRFMKSGPEFWSTSTFDCDPLKILRSSQVTLTIDSEVMGYTIIDVQFIPPKIIRL